MNNLLIIQNFGLAPYEVIWQRMKAFTATRSASTPDEIWVGEHQPVFTQGQAGKPEHLLNPGLIPVIQSDRGGQATYHGPGQLIAYILCDLKRKNLNIPELVTALEKAVIALLAEYQISGSTLSHAPGVYIEEAKIASIGLRIRQGCSYHGLSLNIAMDLEPFTRINPCGEPQRKITQMTDFVSELSIPTVTSMLYQYLSQTLNYTTITNETNIERFELL